MHNKLIDIIKQVGANGLIFFTFSAADLHWLDLHNLISNISNIIDVSLVQAIQTCYHNLNENLHIATWFFICRFEKVSNTPVVDWNAMQQNENSMNNIIAYIDLIVTAMNPNTTTIYTSEQHLYLSKAELFLELAKYNQIESNFYNNNNEVFIDPSTLNDKQRKIYNYVTLHYFKTLPNSTNQSIESLYAIIIGIASISKSYIIKAIHNYIFEIAQKYKINPKEEPPILILAPTGVIAFNINEEKSGICFHMQFPLCLAWAITIHKSQDLTLLQTVLDIDNKEFAIGFIFIAVARVYTLSDLLFSSTFSYDRLQKLDKSTCLQQRLAKEQKLLSL
ncbi:346_t:CDS:2 [Cetraspora pellucida]|uniref:346_t:CDS:1 n=1 Tax=Cetraspora pellucida TaxID=1433469 RepID=A0A9N9G5U5_9GLOM|nr:346_t:CDS:2 [Cetraspora pellucida]